MPSTFSSSQLGGRVGAIVSCAIMPFSFDSCSEDYLRREETIPFTRKSGIAPVSDHENKTAGAFDRRILESYVSKTGLEY